MGPDATWFRIPALNSPESGSVFGCFRGKLEDEPRQVGGEEFKWLGGGAKHGNTASQAVSQPGSVFQGGCV